MAWDYKTTDELDAWVESLEQPERNEIAALLDALTRLGPSLGRPHADVLNGSSYANMKELRGKTPAAVLTQSESHRCCAAAIKKASAKSRSTRSSSTRQINSTSFILKR